MRLPAAVLTAAVTVPLLLATSGCTKESERAADRTTEASPSATSTTTGTTGATGTATGSPGSGGASYPSFAAEDYSYHLEVLCYCPQVGTVEVVVRDGEVTQATSLDGPAAGTAAPDFAWLSIDDIIEQANAPGIAKAKVKWPDGQDHPTSVMLDRIANAVDDEVTYTIKDVQVP
ncbi:hypothetical protein FHP29_17270 [Nocardioides albidus]|uniref:Lipoprotein n=1 Tax=Nocardioides albidus TaxID=1517589 RepID=A0A5C4VQ05_9ACTN|nr:DUF6174 domain-containing protein [Nocardioides albidus]TNM37555.1 hypothetical protein FHP29_17270 [Nocardioides albidus]